MSEETRVADGLQCTGGELIVWGVFLVIGFYLLFDGVLPAGEAYRSLRQERVALETENARLLEQRDDLVLERDPDGGSRAGDWMTELVGDPLQYDENGDGVVTRDELPAERVEIILNHHDRNHDGVITKAEADLFHDMVRIRKGETGR